jgi:hypothetical protein
MIRTRFEAGTSMDSLARELGLTTKQIDASLRSTAKASLQAATLRAQSGLYIDKNILKQAYFCAREVAGARSNQRQLEAGATADSLKAALEEAGLEGL